jgi:xylulokinase
MASRIVAGVDCSTQATKVVLVDLDTGGLVGSGRVANEVVRSGAASETDPENWWAALAGALPLLLISRRQPGGGRRQARSAIIRDRAGAAARAARQRR